MSQIILPGDSLAELTQLESAVTIGPGIYKSPRSQNIIPLHAGILKEVTLNKKTQEKLIYVDSNSKRYIPQANDLVIGIVIGTYSDAFKVSLQEFSMPVQLSMMAFPNATKKNRPNIKVGQAVYARVSEAVPEVATEIECIDPETGKDGGFGALDEAGYLFDVNMNFARELLFNKSSVFLEKLASRAAFEIAIGINGKVWIKCGATPDPSIAKEEDKEDVDMDKDLTAARVNDMKMTLAAANYLISCQYIEAAEAGEALKKAFRGTTKA
ncbi:hypothetical protein PUMCH_001197 [Australozyma saopauloensis]|uniref:Ribosomal RNA-processing protein 40 n=1 Tax=Australozyma saopauloensis TaxID=291208 RepID=A0AAX4H654_9ASCO|nr:hypothetical protein PUMCH_001197 [[Candida] saopauloensis]